MAAAQAEKSNWIDFSDKPMKRPLILVHDDNIMVHEVVLTDSAGQTRRIYAVPSSTGELPEIKIEFDEQGAFVTGIEYASEDQRASRSSRLVRIPTNGVNSKDFDLASLEAWTKQHTRIDAPGKLIHEIDITPKGVGLARGSTMRLIRNLQSLLAHGH